MGMDLVLLPLDAWHNVPGQQPWGYSHTVLQLPRDYELQDAISDLSPTELPAASDVSSYLGGNVPDGSAEGETMYGTLTTDPYGNPYTYVLAVKLAKVLVDHYPKHPTTAYVKALSPETLVVLRWC